MLVGISIQREIAEMQSWRTQCLWGPPTEATSDIRSLTEPSPFIPTKLASPLEKFLKWTNQENYNFPRFNYQSRQCSVKWQGTGKLGIRELSGDRENVKETACLKREEPSHYAMSTGLKGPSAKTRDTEKDQPVTGTCSHTQSCDITTRLLHQSLHGTYCVPTIVPLKSTQNYHPTQKQKACHEPFFYRPFFYSVRLWKVFITSWEPSTQYRVNYMYILWWESI